jgi:hypothetical protein
LVKGYLLIPNMQFGNIKEDAFLKIFYISMLYTKFGPALEAGPLNPGYH